MASLPTGIYVVIGSVVILGALSQGPVDVAMRASQNPPQTLSAAPAGSRGVRLDGTGPLTLERLGDSTRLMATVFLQSESSAPQSVDLSAHVVDADGKWIETEPDPKTVLIQSAVTPVTIVIRQKDKTDWSGRLPARGYLTLTTRRDSSEPITAFREIRLVPPLPSALQSRVVWIPLVVATALVALSWLPTKRGASDRMGSPTWAESWGSTMTLGAALLTSLLGITSFPADTRFLPRSSYPVLSAVFSALIVVSPAVYAFFRTPMPVMRNEKATVQHQGFVGMFLISAGLTVWATLGQLATTLLALLELGHSSVLSAIPEVVFLVLVVALMLLVSLYSFLSISRLLNERGPIKPYVIAATETGRMSPIDDWPLL